MIKNQIILIIIIIFNISIVVRSQGIPLFTQLNGFFDLGSSWNLDPIGSSVVGISNPNGLCTARYPVSKETIYVGYFDTDRNITFRIMGPTNISNELNLNYNVTVHFDNIADPIDTAEISHLYLRRSDSIVTNTGRMSGKRTQVTNNGIINNYGDMRVGVVENTNAQVYTFDRSYTQINGYSSKNSYSLFSGTLNFNNVSIEGGVLFDSTSETIFKDSSTTFNIQNIAVTRESSLLIESTILSSLPFDQDVKCKMRVTDSSSVSILNKSDIQFINTTVSLVSSARFNITNSNMNSDSNINMQSNTLISIKDNGSLSTKNLFSNGNSMVELISESKFESRNLILKDYSKMNLDSSSIDIGVKSDSSSGDDDDGDESVVNLPDSTVTLVGLANSSSITAKNSSNIVISGSFGMINSSSIVVSNSTMNITKSFRSFDQTLLDSTDSTIEIKDEFDINDDSSFSFKYSSLDISGSFNVNSNKTLNIQREFLNSNLNIDGKLFNIGKLLFEKSNINLNKNFTTIGQIKSNQTSYSILLGQLNVYGLYDGIGDKINLSNGQMNINKLSVFNCENCEIESNGSVNQARTSRLNLLGSSFINKKGQVALDGDFTLDSKSRLTNSGSLTLTTDILLNDNRVLENDTLDTFILNQGEFHIKNGGESGDESKTTNVYVDFENRGSLLLSSNSIFHKQINQLSGNISITNKVDIQSNQTILLNGGSLFGNGSVTALQGGISNNNATLGSTTSYYQLQINGNYNQSTNGTMVVTIDSIDTISLVNINGSAIINGTLIVRMNKNMVQDTSNYNKSMTIMQTNQMEGGYSNVQFKTYDPSTGKEIDDTNGCNNYQLKSSSSSFSVLLMGNNCDNNKPLSTPQIIGIAVGGFAFVAIGIMIASYFIFTKYRYSENSIKLKKIISKFK